MSDFYKIFLIMLQVISKNINILTSDKYIFMMKFISFFNSNIKKISMIMFNCLFPMGNKFNSSII